MNASSSQASAPQGGHCARLQIGAARLVKRRCIGRDIGNPLPAGPSIASAPPTPRLYIRKSRLPFFHLSAPPRRLTPILRARLPSRLPRALIGVRLRLRTICGLTAAQRHAQGLKLEGSSNELRLHALRSFHSSQERLSIQVQLIRGKDRCTIWSNAFEYDRNNLNHIHTDLAEKVSRAISNNVLMSAM